MHQAVHRNVVIQQLKLMPWKKKWIELKQNVLLGDAFNKRKKKQKMLGTREKKLDPFLMTKEV